MPDKKGMPVEKFRVTKEQKNFTKGVKAMQEIAKLLEFKTMSHMAEGEDIRQMWLRLEQGLRMLQPPKKQIKEFPGMNFADDELENMEIKY